MMTTTAATGALPEEMKKLLGVIDRAADTLKSLSHPARLLICCQLRFGEKSVGDLEKLLGLKQPNLSRELGKLRDSGFVTTRRQSKLVFYRLTDNGISELLDAICLIFLQDPGFLKTGNGPSDPDMQVEAIQQMKTGSATADCCCSR